MAKQFSVSFYHKKKDEPGRGSAVTIQGTVGQALGGSESETAVKSYLEQKYRGEEITIRKLDWR